LTFRRQLIREVFPEIASPIRRCSAQVTVQTHSKRKWSQAMDLKGNDWAELRMVTKAPPGINIFAFDFAFLSVEYPVYFGDRYNDLSVWLDSN
jgi:hypothetical protein